MKYLRVRRVTQTQNKPVTGPSLMGAVKERQRRVPAGDVPPLLHGPVPAQDCEYQAIDPAKSCFAALYRVSNEKVGIVASLADTVPSPAPNQTGYCKIR